MDSKAGIFKAVFLPHLNFISIMKPFAYIKFWLKSSDEHGIHSPFVFNWITQGLYSKNPSWDSQSAKEVFVERVFTYFKPKKVAWMSVKPIPGAIDQAAVFFSSFDPMRDSTLSVQLIYIDETSLLSEAAVVEALSTMGNDAFVLIDKRQMTPELSVLWNKLVESLKTTVTMDFYYYGLVFVRREQLKQHFSIRL